MEELQEIDDLIQEINEMVSSAEENEINERKLRELEKRSSQALLMYSIRENELNKAALEIESEFPQTTIKEELMKTFNSNGVKIKKMGFLYEILSGFDIALIGCGEYELKLDKTTIRVKFVNNVMEYLGIKTNLHEKAFKKEIQYAKDQNCFPYFLANFYYLYQELKA